MAARRQPPVQTVYHGRSTSTTSFGPWRAFSGPADFRRPFWLLAEEPRFGHAGQAPPSTHGCGRRYSPELDRDGTLPRPVSGRAMMVSRSVSFHSRAIQPDLPASALGPARSRRLGLAVHATLIACAPVQPAGGMGAQVARSGCITRDRRELRRPAACLGAFRHGSSRSRRSRPKWPLQSAHRLLDSERARVAARTDLGLSSVRERRRRVGRCARSLGVA